MPASLDRRQAVQAAKDRMLVLATPDALVDLKNLIDGLELSTRITLAGHQPATPHELLTLAKHYHLQSGPFRRIFAVLDLPVGEASFQNLYKASRDLVRHHDILGNVLFRVLFSRPDFSLWRSLHATIPQAPIDSLNTAIKQAQSLARIRALNPTDHILPFTEVHELISYFLRMSQRIRYR